MPVYKHTGIVVVYVRHMPVYKHTDIVVVYVRHMPAYKHTGIVVVCRKSLNRSYTCIVTTTRHKLYIRNNTPTYLIVIKNIKPDLNESGKWP